MTEEEEKDQKTYLLTLIFSPPPIQVYNILPNNNYYELPSHASTTDPLINTLKRHFFKRCKIDRSIGECFCKLCLIALIQSTSCLCKIVTTAFTAAPVDYYYYVIGCRLNYNFNALAYTRSLYLITEILTFRVDLDRLQVRHYFVSTRSLIFKIDKSIIKYQIKLQLSRNYVNFY